MTVKTHESHAGRTVIDFAELTEGPFLTRGPLDRSGNIPRERGVA